MEVAYCKPIKNHEIGIINKALFSLNLVKMVKAKGKGKIKEEAEVKKRE